jgi:hypothetical protein
MGGRLMSIVLADAFTEDEARRITTSIQLLLDSAQSTLDRLEAKVIEAYERRADLALGYASWGEYADAEFSDKARYLPRADRREFTIKLSERGMSSRAIAPLIGVSDRQVRNDVGSNFPPVLSDEPGRITKLTGSNSVADALSDVPDLPVNPLTGEVYEAGDTSPQTVTETHTVKIVTGLDGKEYKTTPKEPRRSSILDDARNAGWQLRKAVERLERIHSDDRYQKNKAEILAALQPHLDFANEVFTDL